jgi:hypothetical protein
MFSTLGISRVHSHPVYQRLQGRAVHTVSGVIGRARAVELFAIPARAWPVRAYYSLFARVTKESRCEGSKAGAGGAGGEAPDGGVARSPKITWTACPKDGNFFPTGGLKFTRMA